MSRTSRTIFGILGGLVFSFCVTADVVHFVNSPRGEEGYFDWRWQLFGQEESYLNWLDITRPSTDQGGLRNGNSVGQLFGGEENERYNITFNAADVAHVTGFGITKALEIGDSVDAELFRDGSWHAGDFDGLSDFPLREVRYMGVRTESGNYGWIAVSRGATGWHNYSFEALAWAYETVPGKGISAGEVPAPGGLAVLTLSLLFGPHKRRREGAAH